MNPTTVSADALAGLRGSEALRLFAYPDPASALARATRGEQWGFVPAPAILVGLPPELSRLDGKPWTLGYGMTVHVDGRPVRPSDRCTEDQAEVWFLVLVGRVEEAVANAIGVPINRPMFDALVMLTWNIGIEAFRTSTLLRHLNAGRYIEAQAEFDRWVRAGGRVEPGLVNRRNREQAWFNDGLRAALADQPEQLAQLNALVGSAA
jgi:GH24 family phage-related lysozyme (muramidase)